MNRIWFDTEFIDDGTRITLVSIGLVREGDVSTPSPFTYYAELLPREALYQLGASDWVMLNVGSHLQGGASLKTRDRVANDIVRFAGDRPEFWAYVADYDWVALSQLYGSLIQRPKGWPWTAFDAYQLPDFKRYAVRPTNAHNALADAIALKKSWLAWRSAWPDFPIPMQSSPSDPSAE